MKKQLLLIILLLIFNFSYGQRAAIPDLIFKNYIQQKFPQCIESDSLKITCADTITGYIRLDSLGIESLEGIQYMQSISGLLCRNNKLNALPGLPKNLVDLYCANNNLTQLPALPEKLEILVCDNNPLTSLPQLPAPLFILHCANAKLSALPQLPKLQHLLVPNNSISTLPTLPTSLTLLDISNNNIDAIGYFPSKLKVVSVSNNKLKCLPRMPDLVKLYCKGNPLTCLPNIPTTLNEFQSPTDEICVAENVNGCTSYPHIKGIVFIDRNNNLIRDENEPGVANAKVSVDDGSVVVETNHLGEYAVVLGAGVHTLALNQDILFHNDILHTVTDPDSIYEFPVPYLEPVNNLKIAITPISFARPGFITGYKVMLQNSGNNFVNNAQLSFNYPSLLDFIKTDVQFSSHISNVLTWNLGSASPGEKKEIRVYFQVPAETDLIGTEYIVSAEGKGNSEENILLSNQVSYTSLITGSYDPNDKTVAPKGPISENQVLQGQFLDYTIRFQNTGTDTAFTVIVRDTLEDKFDLSSIELISASHNYEFLQRGKALRWTFTDINLPDSVKNEPESHGYVRFRVKLKNTLVNGNVISNYGAIYFDFNDPIITDTVSTEINSDVVAGLTPNKLKRLSVYPQPAKDIVFINDNFNTSGNGLASIATLSGQVINQVPFDKQQSNTITIPLSGIKEGMYILSLQLNGEYFHEKIVIE
ncbi:DUF7619 domain-containing protein [Sporocytophaga myxococcoides]|uniref:DUF7619 domain-containing protein n=1 Tax=Sporocytophaga myxococcoides TaxID=153721 RepID=UPI0003F6C4D6|nr:T9SS type A sorting domain-containing protein [Sporocytophaga myxococcoides]